MNPEEFERLKHEVEGLRYEKESLRRKLQETEKRMQSLLQVCLIMFYEAVCTNYIFVFQKAQS